MRDIMEAELNNRTKIEKDTQMRDSVFNRLYDLSENDRDIMVFTADQGASSLDRWRTDRKNQYRDVGIAEQALVSIGAGMAKEGKNVFIYAIAPFITTRIHEFHKLNAGVQKIPYNIIGIGAGFSYGDSGPTHYQTEDISIMRVIPNMEIYSPSDSVMAATFAEKVCYSDKPSYLRLDRSILPILANEDDKLEEGFRETDKGDEVCLLTTGYMVHKAREIREKVKNRHGKEIGVVDLYKLKPLDSDGLMNALRDYDRVVTLEEHLLAGGLGSMISEMFTDKKTNLKLDRVGIDDRYCYFYGRENIQRELGIGTEDVIRKIFN
jgi:transketolase